MEEIPIFEVSINPEHSTGENELGMDEIAFTSDPAIMVKGVAFRSQENKELFADKKKYRITAPAMIPMDIYRSDDEGEYEVRFTEDNIEDIFVKFMSDLRNNDLFNIEHQENERAPAYILEAWLVDNPKKDKAFSTFGIDVPKGTLMITAQITDQEFYEEIVVNERFGFSIEAFLGLIEPTKLSNQQTHNNMQLENEQKFSVNGKEFQIVDGVPVEVKLANDGEHVEETASEVTEEVVEAPVAETAEAVAMMEEGEEKEEELNEEETVTEEEEVVVEAEVNPETDSEAIMAIVAPILEQMRNEVLQEVAAMLNEQVTEEEESPSEDAEVNMSGTQKFKNVVKFLTTEK